MTFNETYISFDDSIEALEEQIEEIAEQLDDLDDDNPVVPGLQSQRSQLATQRKGAIWARDRAHESDDFPMWDEDVDGVTLSGVRAGTFAGIEKESAQRDGEGTDLLLIADGTVDAPYVDDDGDDDMTAAAVGQLHPYYRDWASSRIDELMDPEGNVIGSSDSPEET
ncbi:hypothetical protein [Haloarcula amylolytica]|uniref:Uncharacterized protein n=1 Tax=Haloarcula amylolytica JCM 13557 TaxID=1227452 RepID=M0KAJ0_9EURY|nr:hypothetical protein [Haloarcula amylolytica]EMA17179.1 hypothetical protein C442_17955 [Haloarcula amylolytica JCM 13557]